MIDLHKNSYIGADVYREGDQFVCEVYQIHHKYSKKNPREFEKTRIEDEPLFQMKLSFYSGGSKAAKKINRELASRGIEARIKSCDVHFIKSPSPKS